ncbi:hypothetical protein ACR3K2_20690 [Cryptosporidium serpentis]
MTPNLSSIRPISESNESEHMNSTTINKILANVQGYYSGDYDWNDFYGEDGEFSLDGAGDDDDNFDSSSILHSNYVTLDSTLQDRLKHFQTQSYANNGSNVGDIRFRQRIRRRRLRDKSNEDNIPDTLHDEIVEQINYDANGPLIGQEEIAEIRDSVSKPKGEYIPDDILMGYHTAWDIGKRGCVAVKLVGDWDSHISPNKVRFFIMDGTDPIAFLTYYTKSDLKVSRGEKSEKKGIIFAKDLKNGYWDYGKAKIVFRRSNKGGQTTILENIPGPFLDAMLVCLREIEVHKRIEKLKKQRRNKNGNDKIISRRSIDQNILSLNSELISNDISSNSNKKSIVPIGNILLGHRPSITRLVAPNLHWNTNTTIKKLPQPL